MEPAAPATAPRRFDPHFRWRSHDVSRTEAIADAVFGLVLGLLFLQDSAPVSFAELTAAVKAVVPFLATFVVIAMIWVEHYLFFRRYGLRDGTTLVLTFLVLFLVLFYAYPLKFLFTFLAVLALGPIGPHTAAGMSAGATFNPLLLYSAGFGAIYLAYAAMYWNAWRQRGDLQLDERERLLTRGAIVQCLLYVAVALLSLAIVLLGVGERLGLGGWTYFLLGPVMAVHGTSQGRRLHALAGGANAQPAAAR